MKNEKTRSRNFRKGRTLKFNSAKNILHVITVEKLLGICTVFNFQLQYLGQLQRKRLTKNTHTQLLLISNENNLLTKETLTVALFFRSRSNCKLCPVTCIAEN